MVISLRKVSTDGLADSCREMRAVYKCLPSVPVAEGEYIANTIYFLHVPQGCGIVNRLMCT
jgi:hypothetical protein